MTHFLVNFFPHPNNDNVYFQVIFIYFKIPIILKVLV